MSLEEGLVAKLSSVSSSRIYPVLPQPATFPAIRYQRIYTIRKTSVDGVAVGVTEAGVQVDCIGRTYEAAKDLADAVRGVLHTYAGAWNTTTSPIVTMTCRYCVLETENDMNEIDGDNRIYWVAQRYRIWTNMS